MFKSPLADIYRPEKLEDVVGQEHILGKGKILSKLVEQNTINNMIFYGPPGVGKTTVANIIAKNMNKKFYKLNATNAGVKDIQNIIKDLDTLFSVNGVILYLDEIQNFNKKQQQSLLEFIENGQITLIASTTENPNFYIYKAILSRCNIFEFKYIGKGEIVKRLKSIVNEMCSDLRINIDDESYDYIGEISGGDLRKALNILEITLLYTRDENDVCNVTVEKIIESSQIKYLNYDKDGDSHYDVLSAFQKSIRGSDPDASIHYLARLIKGGDLISICRRLLVIASEDIGLAYPQAATYVKSCVDSARELGFPEAQIPLAEAVLLLSTAPKSNSAVMAIGAAISDIDNLNVGDIPIHLKDSHYSGAKSLKRGLEYKYPHNFPNNYIKQSYLPENIKDKKYYVYGNNKLEKSFEEYWNRIKK